MSRANRLDYPLGPVAKLVICFDYDKGDPGCHTQRNGDPGRCVGRCVGRCEGRYVGRCEGRTSTAPARSMRFNHGGSMTAPSDRRTHMDLLDQVATSTHERDEVRRILGGLTEADIDAQIRYKRPSWTQHTQSACSGACLQGRSACLCPEACQISEPDDALAIWRGLRLALGIVAAAALAVALAWRMFHG